MFEDRRNSVRSSTFFFLFGSRNLDQMRGDLYVHGGQDGPVEVPIWNGSKGILESFQRQKSTSFNLRGAGKQNTIQRSHTELPNQSKGVLQEAANILGEYKSGFLGHQRCSTRRESNQKSDNGYHLC